MTIGSVLMVSAGTVRYVWVQLGTKRRRNDMRVEPDGFKHPEAKDSEGAGIHATYDNTVLLHEQIRELREAFDQLLQKLEAMRL